MTVGSDIGRSDAGLSYGSFEPVQACTADKLGLSLTERYEVTDKPCTPS